MTTNDNLGGVFFGRTLLQQRGSIGGSRYVFVKLQGNKNDLVFPTYGGQLKNPFRTAGKIFAGDLFEYRTNDKGEKPTVYLLKTFEVAKETSDTTVMIKRDGYRHIPCVGDVLMKAPDTFDAQGAAYTVTAVTASTETAEGDVWKITLNTALGSLVKGDILVEADKEHASEAKMIVQNPNSVAACDYDCLYTPVADTAKDDEFDAARYFITPALHGTMYVHRMSPMPKVVLGINKSRINGWFEI